MVYLGKSTNNGFMGNSKQLSKSKGNNLNAYKSSDLIKLELENKKFRKEIE